MYLNGVSSAADMAKYLERFRGGPNWQLRFCALAVAHELFTPQILETSFSTILYGGVTFNLRGSKFRCNRP
jgi:hypothetical protein